MRIVTLFLAVAFTVPPQAAAEQDQLGRLFFTPTQRAALDAGKRITSERKTAQRPRKPRGPERYSINGVITRSDGERTIWVNSKAYHDRSPPGTRITVDPDKPDSVLLRPGTGRKPVEVKVSQEFDRTSGTVRERYEVNPSETASSAPPAVRKKARAARASEE